MNNNQTLEKMKQMKFYGMQRTFESVLQNGKQNDLTADELIATLIESEWIERLNRKTKRLIKAAGFRYNACVENINYAADRSINKNLIMRLADCQFIDQGENIIITGATGVGKSYIASALGYQACFKGYKVMYFNLSKLLLKFKMSKADGSYMKELKRIEKQDMLIIDDFGLHPIEQQDQFILLDIIEERHNYKSTIITSQIPTANWYELIEDNTIADAILDRLVHTAHRIELKGESMRKKINKSQIVENSGRATPSLRSQQSGTVKQNEDIN